MRESMIVMLLVAMPFAHAAQTVTAYKKGERTAGTSKTCVYEAQGQEYVRTVDVLAMCPLSISVRPTKVTGRAATSTSTTTIDAAGRTVTRTGEQVVGKNKRCFYQVDGTPVTRTVASADECPATPYD